MRRKTSVKTNQVEDEDGRNDQQKLAEAELNRIVQAAKDNPEI
jgi:hypothetical protein